MIGIAVGIGYLVPVVAFVVAGPVGALAVLSLEAMIASAIFQAPPVGQVRR